MGGGREEEEMGGGREEEVRGGVGGVPHQGVGLPLQLHHHRRAHRDLQRPGAQHTRALVPRDWFDFIVFYSIL